MAHHAYSILRNYPELSSRTTAHAQGEEFQICFDFIINDFSPPKGGVYIYHHAYSISRSISGVSILAGLLSGDSVRKQTNKMASGGKVRGMWAIFLLLLLSSSCLCGDSELKQAVNQFEGKDYKQETETGTHQAQVF